jgi:hypothetical protein
MPCVSPDELVRILLAHPKKGAKQVSMTTVTRPKLLRKSRLTQEPCPFVDGVEKIAVRSVTLGASYEGAVNRQRIAERDAGTRRRGDGGNRATSQYFKAQALWNGMGVHDTAYTVKHAITGRRCFGVKPAQGNADNEVGSLAVARQEQWTDVATGRVLDYETDRLAEFLRKQVKSNVQDVRHDVQWRTIPLDEVIELKYGDCYQVIQPIRGGDTRTPRTRKAG